MYSVAVFAWISGFTSLSKLLFLKDFHNWACGTGLVSLLLQMRAALTIISASILLLGFTVDAGGRKITVFPKNAKGFRCQVGPEKLPVALEEGMLRLRVGIVGGKGPFYWRVPFRKWSDGDNQISLAQAGESDDEQGYFGIALDPSKLPYHPDKQLVQLRLIAKNGAEANCTTELSIIDRPKSVVTDQPATMEVAPALLPVQATVR